MEGEWHTLHRIEELSNLISLLREYEANPITRNAMCCKNRYDLLNSSRGVFRGGAPSPFFAITFSIFCDDLKLKLNISLIMHL